MVQELSRQGRAGASQWSRPLRDHGSGRQVLATPPTRIDIKFLQRFPEFAAFRGEPNGNVEMPEPLVPPSKAGDAVTLTPDETIREAHRRLDTALADDLLGRVRGGSPAFFERVVVQVLLAMGYGGSVGAIDQALTGGAGDGGVDGVIDRTMADLPAFSADRVCRQATTLARSNCP